jgi:hypothetical protein
MEQDPGELDLLGPRTFACRVVIAAGDRLEVIHGRHRQTGFLARCVCTVRHYRRRDHPQPEPKAGETALGNEPAHARKPESKAFADADPSEPKLTLYHGRNRLMMRYTPAPPAIF